MKREARLLKLASIILCDCNHHEICSHQIQDTMQQQGMAISVTKIYKGFQ